MSDVELSEPLRALAETIGRRIAKTKGRDNRALCRPDALLDTYGAEERAVIAALDDVTRAAVGRHAAKEAIIELGFSADPSHWRFATDLAEIWHVSPFGKHRAALADRLLAAGVVAFGDNPPCRIDVRPETIGPVTHNLLEELVEAIGVAADGCRLNYDCVVEVDLQADAYAVVYASNFEKHFLDFEDPESFACQNNRRVLLIAGLQPTDDAVKAVLDALATRGFVAVGLVSVVDPVLSHGGHPYARFNLPFCSAFAFDELMEHFLARGILSRDRFDACRAYHRSGLASSP